MRKASNGEPEPAARGNLFADKDQIHGMKTASSNARKMREDLLPSFWSSLEDFESSSDLDTLPQHKPDLVIALLEDALRARASDIHIEPHTSDVCVRLRIDGSIIDVAKLAHTQARWLSNQIKAIADLDPIVRFTPKDAHATVNLNGMLLNLRLALAPAQSGEAMAIRLLDTRRLERFVDDLGLSGENMDRLREWMDSISGMFLAAGPTGTGKTTTIYAMLHELK